MKRRDGKEMTKVDDGKKRRGRNAETAAKLPCLLRRVKPAPEAFLVKRTSKMHQFCALAIDILNSLKEPPLVRSKKAILAKIYLVRDQHDRNRQTAITLFFQQLDMRPPKPAAAASIQS